MSHKDFPAQPNDTDHRPRARDGRLGTAALSRGSVHPLVRLIFRSCLRAAIGAFHRAVVSLETSNPLIIEQRFEKPENAIRRNPIGAGDVNSSAVHLRKQLIV